MHQAGRLRTSGLLHCGHAILPFLWRWRLCLGRHRCSPFLGGCASHHLPCTRASTQMPCKPAALGTARETCRGAGNRCCGFWCRRRHGAFPRRLLSMHGWWCRFLGDHWCDSGTYRPYWRRGRFEQVEDGLKLFPIPVGLGVKLRIAVNRARQPHGLELPNGERSLLLVVEMEVVFFHNIT